MENVKILHTADIHIGAAESFLGLSADKRRFETVMTFERILDLAKAQDVKVVALAGDIFDSNRIEDRFIDLTLTKVAEIAPIKVIFAAGNHDPLNAESPFVSRDLPKNLYVLGVKDECITFEDLKLKVYGRSFENPFLKGEEGFTLKTDKDYINLMVQHGELKSDLNSEYNAITPAFVKNCGMDYIALGHVHKRTDIGKMDSTYFAYCGCPEGQGFDELDEKGVYIGEIGKNVCNLEFVPVSKRQHILHKADISDCADTESICKTVLEQLSANYGQDYRENLYKIELCGEVSAETQIILPEITTRLCAELFFAKVKDKTEISTDLEGLANEISLKGIFVKRMLERIKNADEGEKQTLQKALKLGLQAFSTEVKYDED